MQHPLAVAVQALQPTEAARVAATLDHAAHGSHSVGHARLAEVWRLLADAVRAAAVPESPDPTSTTAADAVRAVLAHLTLARESQCGRVEPDEYATLGGQLIREAFGGPGGLVPPLTAVALRLATVLGERDGEDAGAVLRRLAASLAG